MAINRGEKEKILNVTVEMPEEAIINALVKTTIIRDNQNTSDIIKDAVQDSFKRLIQPAIEREIRNLLTEKAEDGAIKVFGQNLKQLLMQPQLLEKLFWAGIRRLEQAAK